MQVSPPAEAGHLPAVLLSDVEAAREGDPTVDDDDLAVVAQIHRLKENAAHRQEVPHAHTRLVQRPAPRGSEREAPVAVEQEAHDDAALGRRHEAIAKPAT